MFVSLCLSASKREYLSPVSIPMSAYHTCSYYRNLSPIRKIHRGYLIAVAAPSLVIRHAWFGTSNALSVLVIESKCLCENMFVTHHVFIPYACIHACVQKCAWMHPWPPLWFTKSWMRSCIHTSMNAIDHRRRHTLMHSCTHALVQSCNHALEHSCTHAILHALHKENV